MLGRPLWIGWIVPWIVAGQLHAAPVTGRCPGEDRVQCLITRRLVHQLKSSDSRVRWTAATTLGKRRARAASAVSALERVIGADREARVREAAVEALSKIGPNPKTSLKALIGALRDPHAGVRERAAHALGLIGPTAKRAIKPIRSLLDDRETIVRLAAVHALGRIDLEPRSAIATMRPVLGDRSAEVRRAAVAALVAHGEKAIPALTQTLKARASSTDARVTALLALGKLGPRATAALPALKEALAHEEARVRRSAAWALGRVGPKASTALMALLKLLLQDPDAGVRRSTATALGLLGRRAKAAIKALHEARQKDADPSVRRAATAALKKLR
jgi:HEAT repeat protein